MSRAKWKFSGVFVAAMIFLSCPAAAEQCPDVRDPELKIIVCTQSINSKKWKGSNQAVNYLNRGNAYFNKGDNDRAIADYNQAISLDPKSAQNYNNRCLAYNSKGDNDRAIADCSQAISLNPQFEFAYNNRCLAYISKGDNDRAIADCNQAISLDPKDAQAYNNRGIANNSKGDNDRAIADYNQAISLDPKYANAYFGRGQSNLFAGSVEKALADLNQASALAPKDAYKALWVDIVGQRNNLPSRLSQTSSQIDMTAWPAPVIRLFMGQMTAGAVLAAADDPDAIKKKGRVCEANLYSGEFSLTKRSKDEATRLFRLAASDCPHDFIFERETANAELRALGVVP